ncbi:hypothetical protein [Streptomyces bluensis]|uniref:ESX-1 secretion-associated protein n=1 Tax=Streptomyces bluensis TaxID=33897 RepID=A0ABW6UU47_9ACTN
MSFDVEPEDVRSFGKQIGRAAEDAQEAKKYARTHGDAVGGQSQEGLILHLLGLHPTAVDRVDDTLERVRKLLDSSSRELDRSAGLYEKTDHDEAARQDATYPASKR